MQEPKPLPLTYDRKSGTADPNASYFDTAEQVMLHKPDIIRRRLKDKRTFIAAGIFLAILIIASLTLPRVFSAKIESAAAPFPLQHTGFLHVAPGCVAWIALAYFADPNHVPAYQTGIVASYESRETPGTLDPMCSTGPASDIAITGYQSGAKTVSAYYYSIKTTSVLVKGKATTVKTSILHNVIIDLSENYSGAIDVNGTLTYSEIAWDTQVKFSAASIQDREAAFIGIDK